MAKLARNTWTAGAPLEIQARRRFASPPAELFGGGGKAVMIRSRGYLQEAKSVIPRRLRTS